MSLMKENNDGQIDTQDSENRIEQDVLITLSDNNNDISEEESIGDESFIRQNEDTMLLEIRKNEIRRIC